MTSGFTGRKYHLTVTRGLVSLAPDRYRRFHDSGFHWEKVAPDRNQRIGDLGT
jgi:hypothetical protein